MASKRRLRRKACSTKVAYPDELAARQGIAGLRRSKPATGFLTPYRCVFCREFHFGHPPSSVRQSMADKRRNA